MEISVIDKSNYLKGLLIIAKKDNQLAHVEKEMIRRIAVKLGFARDFYEDTLRNLLSNKYIIDTPIHFSEKAIAESFVRDGLILAYSDNKISEIEIDWLYTTAIANNIEPAWFEEKKQELQNSGSSAKSFALLSII